MPNDTPLRTLLHEHTIAAAAPLAIPAPDAADPLAVRCLACGHRCLVRDGREGVCRVRFNRGGELRVPAGYVAGLQVDPIEKKPFYHAYPGRNALSFGMLGCDYHCSYCQNWVTSQALRDDDAVSRPRFCTPDEIVELAVRHAAPVMVSTYNEPLITTEWALEIFRRARARGIVCGYVSNGNATPEVLELIRPWVDLYKVDLKGFDDKRYRELGGVLERVLDTIRRLKQMDFWCEVVTLVVPGFNDSDDELRRIADFLASVSSDIPWHVTAFHSDYRMTAPQRTPVDTLLRAYELGRAAGLRFVYPGNVHGRVDSLESTHCPACGEVLIDRVGFFVRENRMRAGGACPSCGCIPPGVWEPQAPRRSDGDGVPLPVMM